MFDTPSTSLTALIASSNDGTDGNPIELEVEMKFKKNSALQMTDTFWVVPHGLDRFWLVSTIRRTKPAPTKLTSW